MAKLYFAEESEVRTHRLDEEPVTVGRSAQNSIVVNDPRSSRRHCRFEPSEDGFRVVDLGSQNGTFVNGSPISTRRLHEGDLVEVGSVRIWFDRKPSEEPPSPQAEGAGADGTDAGGATNGDNGQHI